MVEACGFAAAWLMSAFVRVINRRIGAKPGPARDVPTTRVAGDAAGSRLVFDAMLRRAGITRVDDS